TWLAMVASAGFERGRMKGVDFGAVPRVQTEMQPRRLVGRDWTLHREQPQLGRRRAIAQRLGTLEKALVAERLEGRVVKAPRLGEILHADRNMTEHNVSSCAPERAARARIFSNWPGG